MRGLLLIVFTLIFHASLLSQKDSSSNEQFISPVKHKIRLSGSFGELRKNHFHTGIDIKGKNSVAGDSIFSVMSGHVSRIRIASGGYGKCLYIDHPNGMTSVYAHLENFNPILERLIRTLQIESESFEIDHYPKDSTYTLQQGQFLGFLGNTGRSLGPHLHFELRESESQITLDPLYYKFGVTDKKAPFFSELVLHQLDSNFQILKKEKFSPSTKKVECHKGQIGVGFKGYDQMDGSNNYNGISDIKLYVDKKLYYHCSFDSISFDEFRYINATIDFKEKTEKNSTYFLCYKQPNNQLSNIKRVRNNGVIEVKKATKITLIIKDLSGNRSVAEYVVEPSKEALRASSKAQIENLTLIKKSGSAKINIPESALYRPQNIFFNFDSTKMEFRIGKPNISCHGYYDLEIVRLDSTKNYKLFALEESGKKINLGGYFDQGLFYVKLNRFGRFVLMEDIVAPKIKFLNKTDSYIKFLVEDNFTVSGKEQDVFISAYVDNNWTPFYYKSMTRHLKFDLDDLRGGKKLFIEALDSSGNKNSFKFDLTNLNRPKVVKNHIKEIDKKNDRKNIKN